MDAITAIGVGSWALALVAGLAVFRWQRKPVPALGAPLWFVIAAIALAANAAGWLIDLGPMAAAAMTFGPLLAVLGVVYGIRSMGWAGGPEQIRAWHTLSWALTAFAIGMLVAQGQPSLAFAVAVAVAALVFGAMMRLYVRLQPEVAG